MGKPGVGLVQPGERTPDRTPRKRCIGPLVAQAMQNTRLAARSRSALSHLVRLLQCRAGSDPLWALKRGNAGMPTPIITPLLPVRQALDDLRAARESARVQLKLLSMEARERKDELQTDFEALEHDIEQSLEHALDSAARRARDLAKGVQDFLVQHAQGRSDLQAPVRSIMTVGVITCEPGDTLSRAAQLLWDHDCGALPVLASDGKLLGTITDRDICMAAYSQGCTLAAGKVQSAMSRDVLACDVEDTIERALELMRSRQLRRLPVVQPDGRLAGILSLADVARFAREISKEGVTPYTALGFTLAAITEPRTTGDDSPRA
jgi:CBS domain-containing protein